MKLLLPFQIATFLSYKSRKATDLKFILRQVIELYKKIIHGDLQCIEYSSNPSHFKKKQITIYNCL